MARREHILSVVILVAGLVVSAGIVFYTEAQAQGPAGITFPIPELGNCANEQACRTYCDGPANISACLAFAEAKGLMSQTEVTVARKFSAAGFKGPGGCSSKGTCEAYCDDINNINECVAFAEAQGFLPPKELAEARAVQGALARGVKPPACGNRRTCDTYCRAPDHMRECVAFGEAAGFISGRELEDAKRVITAIERGVTPPPCGGKEECETYCAEEANFPKCIAFAEAAGFVSADEAAMARKTGGKGPGDCRGREECESYCNNPANQEACFGFAKEHGFIKEGDLQRMEEGRTKFQEGFRQAPPEISECLKATVGAEVLEKLTTSGGMPPRDLGEKMRACFEQLRPSGGRPPGAPGKGGEGTRPEFVEGFGPPLGEGFGPPPGEFQQPPSGFTGPGGCTTPEACRSYCELNPAACGSSGPPSGANIPRPQKFEDQSNAPSFPCRTPEECARITPPFTDFQKPPEGFDRQPSPYPSPNQYPPSGSYPQPQPQPQPGQYPQEFYNVPNVPPPPSSAAPGSFFGLLLSIFQPLLAK